MINVSGYKVWPQEVEYTLYEHPQVMESATISVPDEYRGENVHAFVALKEGEGATEEELITFCKERMADYKYPRKTELLDELLDELPKAATGEFLRRKLRDQAQTKA